MSQRVMEKRLRRHHELEIHTSKFMLTMKCLALRIGGGVWRAFDVYAPRRESFDTYKRFGSVAMKGESA